MVHAFNEVTVLITNYNRSLSLENLLKSFQALNCQFAAIIVTDDGSQPLHLDRIKKLQQKFSFELLTSPRNMGAGYNMNKGQRAVKTPYTLFVEDDFEAGAQFPAALRESLAQMNKRSELDIVRFYAYFRYPYLKPYSTMFSEMVFSPLAINYRKVHYYSDHPHLRRSSFLDKFGPFDETTPPDQTEYRMCISFLQNKGKGLFYEDHTGLFYHNNSVEPSTIQRSGWQKSSGALMRFARVIYRQLKHNYDIHFMNVGRRHVLAHNG
ncbi:glycosyltransferase [Spirosoma sp. RP8]|uniref:Glycosyltransferase n=1 Tax=Spirosoma liriopis TaxID=2937440 RepID=A0ABT0HEY2_9BACT|nr:glycosyltransferase [Spirosoma liriopis]MCK8490417.1 glycosyltransferase [Spirosoma liriopis]